MLCFLLNTFTETVLSGNSQTSINTYFHLDAITLQGADI
jgi:hypothetical protein